MKNETIRNVKGALSESYEALRDFAVYHKMALAVPRGLALFLRRGMPGWIEAWSKPMLSDQVMTVKSPAFETGRGSTGPLSPEAATILANMALAAIRRDNP